MLTINERKLKITGTACIPDDLVIEKNYDLIVKNAEVDKSTNSGNNNGTIDIIYSLKLSELSEVAIVDGREIIKAKVKGSLSKKLRYELQNLWERTSPNTYPDFEDYYKTRMANFIDQIINE